METILFALVCIVSPIVAIAAAIVLVDIKYTKDPNEQTIDNANSLTEDYEF